MEHEMHELYKLRESWPKASSDIVRPIQGPF
jgi:hypothetical protein